MAFVIASKPKCEAPPVATSRPALRRARVGLAPCGCSLSTESSLGPGQPSSLIQSKLKVGQTNDKFEQEADRVADEVTRMPAPPKPHMR